KSAITLYNTYKERKMRLAIILTLLINMFPVLGFSQIAPEDKNYFISAGDIISINVFPAEEFSREVTVQPDGTVEIPLLGSIKVEGKKPIELQNILTAKFSKYVSNPSITVNLRKFSSNRVAIIGEVNGAGYHPFYNGMRLLDLVAQAGGFKDYAKLEKVRIFRNIKGSNGKVESRIIRVDMAKIMKGEMVYNEVLLPGDIVQVPKKSFSKTTRWLADNILPWLTIVTFGMVISR
ncbi:MAG: polysaccharide biosynthesis/export family protein, partial [Elusimicrobiota bacterium]|nr:polysaccharide biosynthesis/export family protein [Elusimicrobiota bacterium]